MINDAVVPFIVQFSIDDRLDKQPEWDEVVCVDSLAAAVDRTGGLVVATRTYVTEVRQETTDDK